MIPRATIDRAKSILISQPHIPLSPAVANTNGNVYVCGAAALALAGVENKHGSHAANEFRRTLCSTSKYQLEDVYTRLGWAPNICTAMRLCNDAARPADRLKALIEKMEEFTPQQIG
jgi:hypothetical protein